MRTPSLSHTCGMGLIAFLLVCMGGGYGGGSRELHASPLTPGTKTPHSVRTRAARAGQRSKMEKLIVYVGTYTTGNSKSKGIYTYQMDLDTGALTPLGTPTETTSPSFLAFHPSHRYLYAVNEVGDYNGQPTGAVSAFSIQPHTGALTPLNQQPSHGTAPCHLFVDSKGHDVLVANYGSGTVAVLPIQADGRLGEATTTIQHQGSSVNRSRQEGPHAHSIQLDAANRFALAADLGLDKVLVYHFDSKKGTLTPNTPPFGTVAPGSGPRHLAFSPNGHYVYVINEMGSTITALTYDAAHGALKAFQNISTLPEGFTGNNTTAEIQMHPSGKFLYGSNRGHDSIAIFAVDPDTGRLRLIGHQSTQGKTPRNFAIDPTGTYLLAANQDTDNIVVFRIDPQTGNLAPTGQVVEVPMPVCIVMMPQAH